MRVRLLSASLLVLGAAPSHVASTGQGAGKAGCFLMKQPCRIQQGQTWRGTSYLLTKKKGATPCEWPFARYMETVTNNHDKDEGQAVGLSRLGFFRHCFVSGAAAATMTFVNVAHAAVPTMDDYERTTTGATVVSQSSSVSEPLRVLLPPQSSSKDPKVWIGALQSSLGLNSKSKSSPTGLAYLVQRADWATLRSALRGEGVFAKNILARVRKERLDAAGDGVEEARLEVAFCLSELEDFALENRSIYFNSMDKKMVDELIQETGFVEKTKEAMELLQCLQQRVNELEQEILKN